MALRERTRFSSHGSEHTLCVRAHSGRIIDSTAPRKQPCRILQNESGAGITPWGVSGDNGTAQGSAQWRMDRLDSLKRMYPDTYQTPEAQQAFMRHELDTTHNGAYKALQAATSPEDAARVFNAKYEISADTTGHRAASARRVFGSDVLPDAGGPSSYISPALAAAIRRD